MDQTWGTVDGCKILPNQTDGRNPNKIMKYDIYKPSIIPNKFDGFIDGKNP
jgi:hypothetical protein